MFYALQVFDVFTFIFFIFLYSSLIVWWSFKCKTKVWILLIGIISMQKWSYLRWLSLLDAIGVD